MKLKKENLTKLYLDDGTLLYQYVCQIPDTNEEHKFFIRSTTSGDVFVYKDDEFENNLQSVFTTKDKIEAWNKFEELVEQCGGGQSSSGGFMQNNPQNNPQVIPLLAIQKSQGVETYSISLFVMDSNGNQYELDTFVVPDKDLEPIDKNVVFVRDFSNVSNIPDLLKCKLLLKYTDKIKSEAHPQADVFFFIPKQILEQNPQQENPVKERKAPKSKEVESKIKQKPEIQKPKEQGDGEGEQRQGEGEQGQGEQRQGEGEGEGQGKGEPVGQGEGEGGGEGEQGQGEQGQDKKTSNQKEPKLNVVDRPDLLKQVASVLNEPTDVIAGFFSRVNSGETFLLTNNFDLIKKSLNLPQNMTARELAEIINKQL